MNPASNSSSATARPPPAARDLLWLLLFFVVVYFVPSGLRPLDNPDEGRYTEIAREMLASGDYISPHLNGALYFEKPPIFYWLLASAESIGGLNLWALHFWPIALAFLGCAVVYGTGRALWGRAAGLWSAAALATSVLYYAIAQVIILDMAVSVFLTCALCAFLLAVRTPGLSPVEGPPGKQRRWFCWALYASMALAVLSKGLIGLVIPGAIILLWLLLLNKWRELRQAHLVSGFFILFAIALPWHIAAARATPPAGGWSWSRFLAHDWYGQGFLWYYIMHEHVLRYIDPGTAHRVKPVWFFPVILTAGFLPWIFFLPQTLHSACKGGWARLKAEPEILLLLLWILFPLTFFSISSSKLVPYILPSVPPLALLTGRFLARAHGERGFPALLWPVRALGVFSLLLAAALLTLMLATTRVPPSAIPWLSGLLVLFTVFGIYSLHTTFRRLDLRRPDLTSLLGCISVLLFVVNPIVAEFLAVSQPSTAAVADWLRPRLQPSDQVFVLWDYSPFQDFAPLLGRTIGVAGQIPDEQEFGLMLEPAKFADRYPGLADYLALRHQHMLSVAELENALLPPFDQILRSPTHVYALVAAKQFPDFQKKFPTTPAYIVWQDEHFVLFSNQAPMLK